MGYEQKPLWRKVNRRTYGVHDNASRLELLEKQRSGEIDVRRGSSRGRLRHGRDYTPLFRFLLKRVGGDWTEIHREAVSRLDEEAPLWYIVARSELDAKPIIGVGESSYYSGLFIDDRNRLNVVDDTIDVDELKPACPCCTHTFNGKPFTRPFDPNDPYALFKR